MTTMLSYLKIGKYFYSIIIVITQIHPEHAPVVLWLQGGPGDTSLFGLFLENGPFVVTKNQTLEMRKYSWNANHNMIYIDNPVGTGYSFTDNDLGYATNETDVGDKLYSAIYQFFKLFPEIRKNEFYVTGESYAGKYVPAVSRAIKYNNAKAKFKINLSGLAIGNGWSDPRHQIVYGDYLYQLGLVDLSGREQLQKLESEIKNFIDEEKYIAANVALAKGTLMFQHLTGLESFFNYLQADSFKGSENFGEWVQRPDVRKAMHVGNCTFHADMSKVARYLVGDITRSVAPIVADLLQHYRVLIYNGQLDIVCAYPMAENYLRNLDWPGAREYEKAARKQWWVGNQLAGYSKTVARLTEVLVRSAGHAVPIDQPLWALDLITRFTHHKSF